MTAPERTCPFCETPFPEGALFCSACGEATPTEIRADPDVTREAPADEAEHRQRIPEVSLSSDSGRGHVLSWRSPVFAAMAAILGAGLLFLVSNVDLPIVRNSFVYAKTAQNIIEHGFNAPPVIADTELSFGKPIGFSVLSLPFVSISVSTPGRAILGIGESKFL